MLGFTAEPQLQLPQLGEGAQPFLVAQDVAVHGSQLRQPWQHRLAFCSPVQAANRHMPGVRHLHSCHSLEALDACKLDAQNAATCAKSNAIASCPDSGEEYSLHAWWNVHFVPDVSAVGLHLHVETSTLLSLGNMLRSGPGGSPITAPQNNSRGSKAPKRSLINSCLSPVSCTSCSRPASLIAVSDSFRLVSALSAFSLQTSAGKKI